MTIPLYIFDLDGTLADLKHRRHHVEHTASLQCWLCQKAGLLPSGKKVKCSEHLTDGWKPNWDAFHAACVDDMPIFAIINTMLRLMGSGADVWIWSGRMDTVRPQTVDWIGDHIADHKGYRPVDLKMRPAGDYTPDDQLKESWLKTMSPKDRARLVCIFDDRDRVVAMWRRNGIVCAQVAPGDF